MTHLHDAAADANIPLRAAGALNISLHGLAADLLTGTRKYVETMLADPERRERAEAEYPKLRIQRIRR